MAIIKDYKSGTYTAVCDECHDVIDEDCESFTHAVEGIKTAGGRLHRNGTDWVHVCRDCVE